MAKGGREKSQQWWRLVLFALIAGGAIWFLSSRVESSQGRVKGESVLDQVEEIIPEGVRKEAEKIQERIFKKSSQVIEEAEVVREVRKTVDQAADEIEGFPDKQKKDVKKEVINQVCNEILEEADGGD